MRNLYVPNFQEMKLDGIFGDVNISNRRDIKIDGQRVPTYSSNGCQWWIQKGYLHVRFKAKKVGNPHQPLKSFVSTCTKYVNELTTELEYYQSTTPFVIRQSPQSTNDGNILSVELKGRFRAINKMPLADLRVFSQLVDDFKVLMDGKQLKW